MVGRTSISYGQTAHRGTNPHRSPTALGPATVALILDLRATLADKGLDNGPHTIAWHLQHHHGLSVSPVTIWRHLKKAGLIIPQPKKRPKTSYIRFAADLPNETWQSDFTHWRLADGTGIEIITFLDDCTRFALDVTAHTRVTGNSVVDRFLETADTMGYPASVFDR